MRKSLRSVEAKKYVETIKRKSLSDLRGFRGADETRTRDLLRDRQAF